MNKVTWHSPSGTTIEFEAYPYKSAWSDVAGVYMFANPTTDGKWHVHYVGQTENLRARLPTHEKWNPAVHAGATTVLAVEVPMQASRDLIERQLIEEFQPRLNDQLKHSTLREALLGHKK